MLVVLVCVGMDELAEASLGEAKSRRKRLGPGVR